MAPASVYMTFEWRLLSLDRHGGSYEGQYKADFLFSDSVYADDTMGAYKKQNSVAVFKSSWIEEVVVKHATVPDIALGKHILIPCVTNSDDSSLSFSVPDTRFSPAKPVQAKTKASSLQRLTYSANKEGCSGVSLRNGSTRCSATYGIKQPGLTKLSG